MQLGKWTVVYKLTKSLEKINHRMYMGDIKLFVNSLKKVQDETWLTREGDQLGIVQEIGTW